MMKTTIYIFSIIIILASASLADKYDFWSSHTYVEEIRYVDYFDNNLQVITSGGWIQIDPVTMEHTKLVNTDGLGTNDLNYIMQDTDGVTWLAGYGRLIRLRGGEYDPFLFVNSEDELLTLYSIADDNNELWIATSTGLARFSKINDDGQIEDFYFRFGDLTSEPVVRDVMITGDTIWLATSDGLAFADKTNPVLLKSFANWNTIRPSAINPGTEDSVTALAVYNNDIYIGTTDGVYLLAMTPTDTTLTRISTRIGISTKHIQINDDKMYIYSTGGFFVYDLNSVVWNYTPSIPNDYFSSGRVVNGIHWVGSSTAGLYYGNDESYTKFEIDGTPGNVIRGFSVHSDTSIAAAFDRGGVSVFNGSNWNSVDLPAVSDGIRDVQYDGNDLWASCWGAGLYDITDDEILNYDETNSDLSGVSLADSYVVVRGLAKLSHYLFMVNYLANDNEPVVAVDLDDHSRWVSFGADDGIMGTEAARIAAYGDVFAVTMPDQGIYFYYFGDDLFDKSDDTVLLLNEDDFWLGSNQVFDVAFDNDGTLWAATNLGASFFDRGIDRFVNINLPTGFGPKLNRITFDKRDNVWMGASNGLGFFERLTGSFEVFTQFNSGLIDDDITALEMNNNTLDLWIGTTKGISVFKTQGAAPVDAIADVIAYPNPFIVGSGDSRLSFNYGGSAMVNIYTVAGELIWENDIDIPWTGKNQNGQEVAPGVYLYLLTTPEGATGKGKILLIRE